MEGKLNNGSLFEEKSEKYRSGKKRDFELVVQY